MMHTSTHYIPREKVTATHFLHHLDTNMTSFLKAQNYILIRCWGNVCYTSSWTGVDGLPEMSFMLQWMQQAFQYQHVSVVQSLAMWRHASSHSVNTGQGGRDSPESMNLVDLTWKLKGCLFHWAVWKCKERAAWSTTAVPHPVWLNVDMCVCVCVFASVCVFPDAKQIF